MFYNEKLRPKLAQNQKHCKCTPLAIKTDDVLFQLRK